MGARGPAWARQALIAFGYALFCTVAATKGPNPFALMGIPVCISVVNARGRKGLAGAMVFATPYIALLVMAAEPGGNALTMVVAAGWFCCIALAGWFMGEAVRRSWTFTRAWTLGAGIAAAATVGYIAFEWERWLGLGQSVLYRQEAELNRNPLLASLTAEQVGLIRDFYKTWFVTYWPDLSLGFVVAQIVGVYALWIVLLNRWVVYRKQEPGLRSGLSAFRPDDSLVWPVIACFAMFLANEYWPDPRLRMVSWNGLIALSAVYWLSGLAILYACLNLYGARRVVKIGLGVLVLLTTIQAPYVLSATGLFDTWIDFRKRFEANLAAQREREEHNDDEW